MYVALEKPGNRVLAFGEDRLAVKHHADERAEEGSRVSVVRSTTAARKYSRDVFKWRTWMTEEEYRLARV